MGHHMPGTLPILFFVPLGAVVFHLWWRSAVDRRDDDLPTEIASFAVLMVLLVVVLIRRLLR